MIADLTARRFEECNDQGKDILSDATVVWAALNLMEDIYTDAEDVELVRAARSNLVNRIAECNLTIADLFENVMTAVEEDDIARFGLDPHPPR